jgi:dipeptidase E
MKLLLTSAGITNQTLADAFRDLVGKRAEEVRIGFISTAATVEEGDMSWYTAQLENLNKFGFKDVDIVDVSTDVNWQDRLISKDAIVVSGGNTFYLLDQMRKTGFGEWFKKVLDQKVYVGISAGSIVMTPTIAIAAVEPGDINLPGLTDLTGFGFVGFEISPHTPEVVNHEGNMQYRSASPNPLYEIDNQSAVQVKDDEVKAVGEGKWAKL